MLLVRLIGWLLARPFVVLWWLLCLCEGSTSEADGTWGRAKHLGPHNPPFPMKEWGFRWPGERPSRPYHR